MCSISHRNDRKLRNLPAAQTVVLVKTKKKTQMICFWSKLISNGQFMRIDHIYGQRAYLFAK